MRNISNLDKIYDAAMEGARQRIDIAVSTIREGDPNFHITEANIVAGSFSIDRYVTSNDNIELGSAIAAELKMTLDNSSHEYDEVALEGASLIVTLLLELSDGKWVNLDMGHFTIDEQPRTLSTIEITALDDMVRFDKNYDLSSKQPSTMERLLGLICGAAGVTMSNNIPWNNLANLDYVPDAYPTEGNVTCRQVLIWICQILGVCAYINADGDLMLGWYEDLMLPGEDEEGNYIKYADKLVISSGHRYSSDSGDYSLLLKKLKIYRGEDKEGKEVVLGTETPEESQVLIELPIEGNSLITNIDAVAAGLKEVLEPLEYTPFTASCISLPFVWPLDKILFESPTGKILHETVVTHHTFRLNGCSEIKGKGTTATKNGYAKANPLTQKEAHIINEAKAAIRQELNSRYEEILKLNEQANHSFGLYTTTIKSPENNSSIFYYHDNEELDRSRVVYKISDSGTSWTDDYQGENTVWKNVSTADGSILAAYISTKGIQAERLEITTTNKVADEVAAQSSDSTGAQAVDNASIVMEKGKIDFIVSGNAAATFNKNEVEVPVLTAGTGINMGKFIIKNNEDRGAVTMTWNGSLDTAAEKEVI